jgi:hypothetical protein
MFRQIIFDNWWVWLAIYDLDSASKIACHRPPEEVVSMVLRDAGLRAHRLFETPIPDLSPLNVASEWSPFRAEDGKRLGTRSLFEGGAVANELQFLLLSGADPVVIRSRFDSLIGGSYGAALREYMARSGATDREKLLANPYTHLWYFLIICDVALNPPLPPVVTTKRQVWNWKEIFPAFRFQRALEHLYVFDLVAPQSVDEALSHSVIEQAVNLLSEACEFSTPSSTNSRRAGFDLAFRQQIYFPVSLIRDQQISKTPRD